MSTEYWFGGKLPGRVEFPDGWIAYTESGSPWGSFLADRPDGRRFMFDLPKSGSMEHTHQVMDDEEQPTGFYVWVVPTDPIGTVRISRQYWD